MLTTARTSRWTRASLVLLVTAYLLTWDVPATSAGETPSGEGGRLVLVLDSSGSMQETAAGGETKIAAAKKALGDVVGGLPEDQPVGLRVYGAEVFSADDAGACTDSQLVVPVETGNRDALRAAISGYKPYGETPIGYALQEAGKDLGNEGKRNIVLVSDGEPTCAPDPCQVARDLAKKGINLRIDVVGLDVDGAARAKLQCIARAGHGIYYDASSSDDLTASLQKLATRAARPFGAIGQPVTGTPTAEGAPTVTAGDWLDEVGAQQEDIRTYEIERELTGSTLHVSASLRNSSSYGEEVRIDLATPEGDRCGEGVDFTQLSAGQLISAGASADDIDLSGNQETDSPCTASDTIIATVTDKTLRDENVVKPLELRVYEEPAVENVEALPEPGTTDDWVAPPSGNQGAETTGGSSFEDAPLLEPGVYRDTIVPGEVLTYRVQGDWGQRISALARFAPMNQKLADAVGNGDELARITLFSPVRRTAASSSTTGGPPGQSFLHPNGLDVGITTRAIAYRNRGTASDFGGATIEGPYTVSVYLEEDPDGDDYLVPFTLSLGVDGQPTGAPEYAEEPVATESPTPSPTQEVTEADTSPTSSASDDDGANLGLLLGGAGVLALAAAALVVVRSRSGKGGSVAS
jgi:Ca-activated chloride channel family protein